jgi:hypothetical protein
MSKASGLLITAVGLLAGVHSAPFAQTSSIDVSGVVRAADSGDLLADVRVLAPDGTRVLSDVAGAFHLTLSRPASLTLLKAGYVRQVVPVGSGQRMPLDVHLVPAGVIAGRVLDQTGAPVIGALVMAGRGPRAAGPGATRVETNDLGEYRLAGMSPGQYVVGAVTTGAMAQVRLPNNLVTLAPSFNMVFYPGVKDAAEAQTINVRAGEEHPRIDFLIPGNAAERQPTNAVGRVGFGMPGQSPLRNDPSTGLRGVVQDSNGRGLPQAQVVVMGMGPPSDLLVLHSDNAGRFEALGLAPGRYNVLASKAGYFATDRHLADISGLMEVKEHDIRDVPLRLTPWGVITGRVEDDLREPITGARVRLMALTYENGRRLLRESAYPATTDDLGSYRIYGVRPGTYLVTATLGDVASADVPGYGLTFAPGADTPGQAQAIDVRAGDTRPGINVQLQRSLTVQVAGRVVSPDGAATTGGSLNLIPSQRSGSVVGLEIGASRDNNGNFAFRNVPPGDYVIQSYRGRSGSMREGDFGSLRVTVNDRDITGLTVQLSSGVSISGRVRLDTRDASPSFSAADFKIVAVPVDFDTSPQSNWAESQATTDGAFELHGVSGTRRLQVVNVPKGWAFRELRLGGVDVTDRPLLMNASVGGLEAVLTDRVSVLSGIVRDNQQRPVASSSVVVFSTDRDRWYWRSRFLRLAVSDGDGRYSVQGLPFGSYYVAVVDQPSNEGEDAWQDPAYLEAISRTATTTTVRDGDQSTLDLRVSR